MGLKDTKMRFVEALAIAIKNLLANKLRSSLTMLGILIGIALVLAMMAIGEGAKQIIIEDIEKIGGLNVFTLYRPSYKWVGNRRVRNRSREHFDYADALAIAAECPSVRIVVPRVPSWLGVLMQAADGRHFRGGYNGVDSNYTVAMEWDLHEGRFISAEDVDNATKVVVLGNNVATALFGEASALGKAIKIRKRRITERFIIIGTLLPRGHSFKFGVSFDDLVFIPITTAQQRFTGTKRIPHIVVQAHTVEDVDTAIEEVKMILQKRHSNEDDFFNISDPRGALSSLSKISTILKIALGSIAGFSLLIGGIGVMNMMFVAVGERTREIGIRKALGARSAEILLQFLSESMILCGIGGILGVGLGVFTSKGVASIAVRIVKIVPNWPSAISVEWVLISVCFSVLLGVGCGLYPAIKAMRMPPIEALRSL